MRFRRVFLGIACSLALAVSACTTTPEPAQNTTKPETPQGQSGSTATQNSVLKVALGSMVPTLDPNSSFLGPPATIIYYALFDPLTLIDEKSEVKPGLAAGWRTVDPTTWEFDLRKGVKFSNGDDLTAEDVKFTYDRVLNPDNKQSMRSRITTIKSVDVIDPHKIRIVTSAPDPILPKRTANIFILPQKYFQQIGAEKFAQQPVGTGAFRMKSFVPSSSVVLEAVPSSWRGQPKVANIEIRGIPEAATRVAALKAGEVDVAEKLPPDLAKDLAKHPDVNVVPNVIGQTNVIVLESRQGGPLANKKVRQALNHAVDKQAILDTIMQKHGQVTGQLVGPNGFGHDPAVQPYPYDPEKAKRLLAEAGFANGFSLTINTTQGLHLNDRETSEAVAGYLNAVGVKTEVKVIEYASFTQQFNAGGLQPAYFIGFWYLPAMDGLFNYVWHQCNMSQSRYCSQEFDKMFAAANSEMDTDKRLKQIQDMARYLNDEAPFIFLFQPGEPFGVRKNVQGFVPRPDKLIWFDPVSVTK